jgi:large subunit ribosomal protein L4
MPTVTVYNTNREKVGDLALDDTVFGAEVKEHLFYAVVRWQLAMRRQGTHSTKGRAEISGGGKKPWKQKGTGRARQGSIRSPQWRGGGVVHGPKPRSYDFKLNRKIRQAALRGALTRRAQENALVVLDGLDLPEIKTRQVVDFMKKFELGEALVILPARDEKVERSARNLQNVTVLPAEGLNVYDVLNHKNLVMTRGAVEAVVARLGGV